MASNAFQQGYQMGYGGGATKEQTAGLGTQIGKGITKGVESALEKIQKEREKKQEELKDIKKLEQAEEIKERYKIQAEERAAEAKILEEGRKPKGLTPEEFGLVPPTPERIAPFQKRFPSDELLVPGPEGTVIGGRGKAIRPLSPAQAATRLYETRGKETRERVKGLGLRPEVGVSGKVGLKKIVPPKKPKETETKEFRQSLSNAITAIERGTVSVEDALNRLYKDWPDKERTLEDFRGRMESLTR